MTTKQTGGPAFPCDGGRRFVSGNEVRKTMPSDGMSLRDYFAAKASDRDVQAVLDANISQEWKSQRDACDHSARGVKAPFSIPVLYSITRQQARYMHADAMLKEREK